jgi:hypothetical protein
LADDFKQILKELNNQGFRVEDVGRRYKVYPPNPKAPMVTLPKTPSRGLGNIVATLRRSGFIWKGH